MAKADDLEYLKTTPLFQRLDDSHLDFLSEHFRILNLGSREVLVKAGDTSDTFYIVMEGMIDLYTSEKKNPVLVQTVGVGKVIGWSWAVSPYRWHYTVQSRTPAMVAEFDGKAIRARCAQDPEFGYAVMKRVCDLMLDRLNHVRTFLAEGQKEVGE